jgi:NAD(P)H-nitrite reductase large subunit
VEALRAAALDQQMRTALVVGSGAMGVEVAEQLRVMGLEVTLTDQSEAPLAEELNRTAQQRLARLMEQNGVRLRCGNPVRGVELTDGGELAVAWKTGGSVFDLVASCAGTVLRVGLAQRAGLEVKDGIVVNDQLRTSRPEILAAGDAAQHPDGSVTNLWRHAKEQGRVAGLNALGGSERYTYKPFRLKVKVFGHYFFALNRPKANDEGAYEVGVVDNEKRYVCAYYRQGRLAGLVMIDDEGNQKAYNKAVVEKWERARVEQAFGL